MKLLITTSIVLMFFYLIGLMYEYEIKTEITINAESNKVWVYLSNLENYQTWNPFIRGTGEFKQGNKLAISVGLNSINTMDFSPVVLVAKENQELRWLGQLFLPGLFDGEHYFTIKANNDGTSTFIHGEKFSGILALLLIHSISEDTERGFRAMNQALKNISEK